MDNWSADEAESEKLQGAMKKAWAQQKYRANLKNKDKKQSTFAISNQTKRHLETLAKVHNVNLNQMLEYIIDEAHENLKKRKISKYPDRDNDS